MPQSVTILHVTLVTLVHDKANACVVNALNDATVVSFTILLVVQLYDGRVKYGNIVV